MQGGTCMFCLQICSAYFFLCRCEYSQFSPGKNPCLNSPTVPNCIFRLLISCNIPILKNESHSEISFVHTWLSSLTSKTPSVSNPGHPSSIHEHQRTQHSLKLLNVCSQHYWRSSFLQATELHRPAFVLISPVGSPTPLLLSPHLSFTCMNHLCMPSLKLHLSSLHGSLSTRCLVCLHPAASSVYKPAPGCWWHSVSPDSDDLFPTLLTVLPSSFFAFLTRGTCAKKMLIGTKCDLKQTHKRSLLLLPLGSPALSSNWGKPEQRVVCWEPPAGILPEICGIHL